MSRKKIVAATTIAAALGLAFAGYTATRANGTEDFPRPANPLPVKADAGYRQNHQIEHNGAIFAWMDAAATLDHPRKPPSDESSRGKDLTTDTNDEEIEPVANEYAYAGSGWADYGHGGGGGTPKADEEWGGGRYAGNFGFGFGGSGGGGGSNNNSKGASGSNDPAGDKPQQDAPAPAGSSDNQDGKPGTSDPKAGDPPATGPSDPDPQPGEQKDDDQPPGGPDSGYPNGGDYPPNDGGNPGPVHSVPEPASLGLLGFGLAAAAALRRRRRS
jgi:PEP-CTERM motif-containing protein